MFIYDWSNTNGGVMKLHFSNEWLKNKIENDPDLPVECGRYNLPRNNTQLKQRLTKKDDGLDENNRS